MRRFQLQNSDHYRHLDEKDPQVRSFFNDLCGDTLRLQMETDRQKFSLFFDGEGCSLSLFSAAVMAKYLSESSLGEVSRKLKKICDTFEGDPPGEEWDQDPDLCEMKEFLSRPVRLTCLAFPWRSLKGVFFDNFDSSLRPF